MISVIYLVVAIVEAGTGLSDRKRAGVEKAKQESDTVQAKG